MRNSRRIGPIVTFALCWAIILYVTFASGGPPAGWCCAILTVPCAAGIWLLRGRP
jgi:hypothetical protein